VVSWVEVDVASTGLKKAGHELNAHVEKVYGC